MFFEALICSHSGGKKEVSSHESQSVRLGIYSVVVHICAGLEWDISYVELWQADSGEVWTDASGGGVTELVGILSG